MAEFDWRGLRFVVREIETYEKAQAYLDRCQEHRRSVPADFDLLSNKNINDRVVLELEFMPVDVYSNGVKLPEGKHVIANGIVMTLPLRIENFDTLPTPLSLAIQKALMDTGDAAFDLIRAVEQTPDEHTDHASTVLNGDVRLH